jgi:DeoR/GlpR family transcriptional regulator of sugar metabolism
LLVARRRELILDEVRANRAVQVSVLAQQFGVSEITVRRDLSHLARAGKVTRVHGGAGRDGAEPPFSSTIARRSPAKQRIGRAAARLVPEGGTVMIDIGTTALELARALRGREVTVVTSNLAVVEELLPERGIELVVLGGVVRRNYRSLVGSIAEDSLRQLAADVAFLGASGLRLRDLGVMDTTTSEVPIKRGMMAAADRSVLLVDEHKLAGGGVVRVCGAEAFAAVVTDADPSSALCVALERAGVTVVRAL